MADNQLKDIEFQIKMSNRNDREIVAYQEVLLKHFKEININTPEKINALENNVNGSINYVNFFNSLGQDEKNTILREVNSELAKPETQFLNLTVLEQHKYEYLNFINIKDAKKYNDIAEEEIAKLLLESSKKKDNVNSDDSGYNPGVTAKNMQSFTEEVKQLRTENENRGGTSFNVALDIALNKVHNKDNILIVTDSYPNHKNVLINKEQYNQLEDIRATNNLNKRLLGKISTAILLDQSGSTPTNIKPK